MKSTIKTIFASAIIAAATFPAIIHISCSKDKCKSVACGNGGSCNNGTCTCVTGYEGTNCQTLTRNKFIGKWGAQNQTASITEPSQFSVSVSARTGGVNYVSIANLHNYFTTAVNAYVSGDSLVIPVQVVMGMTVSGVGFISSSSVYGINNTVNISYQVVNNSTHLTDMETEIWNG